jgi:MFS transporter, putative metabolite:H+ symporter
MSTSAVVTTTALQQIDSRPLTRNQKSLVGLAITGNVAEFFDIFLIGFVVSLLVKPWKLTGFESGTILALSGLGTVVGAILWGRLADKIGRKVAFKWCVIIFVVFTAISVFTPDRGWWMLALLRVGVGIGVGGLNITSIPYVQEFVPAKQRGLLSGLVSVFIPLGLLLGSMAQAWLSDIIGWRGLIALGAIPILLLFWLRRVPESPRFLQAHGRPEEAKEALAWALELPVSELGALPEITETHGSSYSVVFKKYGKSLAIISVGSFCFILGSFTIQSWGQTLLKEGYGYSASLVGYMFMGVSIADLLGRLASAWLADRVGRRWVMFSFGMIGGVGSLVAAWSQSGSVFFIGLLIVMAFGDGAFGILNAFGAEQFPNEVRSTGLGLGYGIGACAKIVGPALMGLIVGGSMVKQDVTVDAVAPAFVLFAIMLFIGAFVYLFAKETKGISLEEI